MAITATLLFVIIILIGGIFLQVFLSKRENKWLGLILPALAFIYSLITILSIAGYPGMNTWEKIQLVAPPFLMFNIPTIILLGIYLACREKKKTRAQLDKMNIQDLD